MTPTRLTDTRVPTNGTPIAANTSEEFGLSTSASASLRVLTRSRPISPSSRVMPRATSRCTRRPTRTVPVASDVNWPASNSRAVPNFTVADTAGTGSVGVYNSHGGTINLLIDAFGYFERQLPTSTTVSAVSDERHLRP